MTWPLPLEIPRLGPCLRLNIISAMFDGSIRAVEVVLFSVGFRHVDPNLVRANTCILAGRIMLDPL